jgi:hypothetical protein
MFGNNMIRALAVLATVQLLFGCSRQLPNGSHERHFDEVLWRSAQGHEQDKAGITPRQKMLGDLVDKNLLGKTRMEVIALLGEPSTKMDPDGAGPALSYPTGFERGSYIRIDSEWLLIYFNPAGKVTGYEIGVD